VRGEKKATREKKGRAKIGKEKTGEFGQLAHQNPQYQLEEREGKTPAGGRNNYSHEVRAGEAGPRGQNDKEGNVKHRGKPLRTCHQGRGLKIKRNEAMPDGEDLTRLWEQGNKKSGEQKGR